MRCVILRLASVTVTIGLCSSVLGADSDWAPVAKALGRSGTEMPGGVLRTALSESKTPLAAPAAAGSPSPLEIDTAAIEQTLGAKGTANGGVYQFNIGRAEAITDGGMPIPIAMGSGIVINFQPTGGGKAAITGDFVLVAEEVNPVLKTLRDNGIEVTALHSHMLEDQPRLFFMHYWANDDAQKLAAGLKAALSKVNRTK